jgi:hypothetical protein
MNRTEPYDTPHETPDVSDIRNPEIKHEADDVGVRSVGLFLFWLLAGVLIVVALMWGLFRWLASRERAAEPPPRSRVGAGLERLPPEPRLQLAPGHEIHPLEDYQQFRAAEETRLQTYGWVNQPTGSVHIPLAEAKRRFLEQQAGRAASPPPAATLPLESSSGRRLERREQ